MTRELQEKLESYQRVWAEVDLDAIWENMVHMKENIAEKTKILAVIKTDGYGHGGVPIAKMLEQLDFMFGYAAATYEEAHVLREAGVKKPILILGYTFPYCYEELIREEIRPAVLRALEVMKTRTPLPLTWEPEVPALVAQGCGGDVRKSINAVELLCEAAVPKDGTLLLTEADAKALSQRSAMRYDRGGDAMYDAASALHKSIRGSDPDAALHYLARFLEAGDLITPCRRLLCAASEDVGLAYPQAITIVKSCVDTAMQLGLPEPGMCFDAVADLCRQLDVPYTRIQVPVYDIVFNERKEKNPCSLCAKLRRGSLNTALTDLGIRKIALGHHYDDAIETLLMNLLFEGRIGCFQPVTYLDRTGITQIRPLLYCREDDIRRAAQRLRLPVVHNLCPANGHSRRQEVKELIAGLEGRYPDIKQKLFGSLQRYPLYGWNLHEEER